MQRQILLKTENLSKTFSNGGRQQHVLKNIDLELYQGDFTVIMGASGAGKSTLLYALSGMDTPSLGKITFGDKTISDLSQDGLAVFRRDHCGFVFQQIYLIDGMSVMDNVLSAGLLVNKDKKAVVSRAKELFAAVDISEETQKKIPFTAFRRRSAARRNCPRAYKQSRNSVCRRTDGRAQFKDGT